MPIVGQFGSLAGFGVFPGGAFESIATVTVGSGGSSAATFASIPSTFQHLQVRFLLANSTYATLDDTRWRLNSDTGANYVNHQLRGDGGSASAFAWTGATFSRLGVHSDSATHFTGGVVDILDYADTSKNTTVRSFHGFDQNGSGNVLVRSGLWLNTAAISALEISTISGLLAQHSTFALYGIKAP